MLNNDAQKLASDLVVLDLGVGMAAALVAQMYAHFGARLKRLEPSGGDPFYQRYPAYGLWRKAEQLIDKVELEEVTSAADVCIVGGEDFPGLDWKFNIEELRRQNPALVVIDITGYSTEGDACRPAVDILVQARVGTVFEQYPSRPSLFACPITAYGTAFQALLGSLSAVLQRDTSGSEGQLVSVSHQQGALFWMCGGWKTAENPDPIFSSATPKGAQQPVFECADGTYVVSMMGVPGSVAGTYSALGIDEPVDPAERGLPDPSKGLRNYFCNRDLLEPAFLRSERAVALTNLWQNKVPADAALQPGETWEESQTRSNGVVETHDSGEKSLGNPLTVVVGERDESLTRPGKRKGACQGRPGPLSGLRVLDLGAFVAGPFASKLLSDLGAEVIKVEPAEGDAMRAMYSYFAPSNRGKRCIVLDLKSEKGLEAFFRLCETADVLTHNLRNGVMERLGITADALKAVNPELITVHSAGYGYKGDKALNSGFDPMMQPYCGHSVRAGGEGNLPEIYNIPLIDYGTGAISAIAILFGVIHQRHSGASCDIKTNLLNVGLYLLSELMQTEAGEYLGAPLLNAQQTGFHPAECLYQTDSGWIAVAALDEAMAQRFANVLGLDFGDRSGWAAREGEQISERVRAFSREELLRELEKVNVWAEPCTEAGWESLRKDESAVASGMVLQSADERYGVVTAIGHLANLSGSELGAELPAFPGKGAHTDSIMEELGYSADEIIALRSAGAIG